MNVFYHPNIAMKFITCYQVIRVRVRVRVWGLGLRLGLELGG